MGVLKTIFKAFSTWGKVLGGVAAYNVAGSGRNFINKITGSHLTDAEKEAADLQLTNQQTLNEEDYQRKIDFYERYESPEAMVRQYKQAGLNPMLLAGNGAGASASGGVGPGSAGMPGSDSEPGFLSSLLSTMLGFFQTQKGLNNEMEIARMRNAVDVEKNRISASQVETYNKYLDALRTGKEKENAIFDDVWAVKRENILADTDLKNQQWNRIQSLMESDSVQRKLWESGIKMNDAAAAATAVQTAILEAQSKYADQYFKATAEIQSWQAQIAQVEGTIFQKTAEKRLRAAEAELADIVIKAGMDARVYDSEAFKKSLEGRMTSKDKAQLWGGIVRTALGSAIAVGGGIAIKAITPAVAPMYGFPGTQPTTFASSYSM